MLKPIKAKKMAAKDLKAVIFCLKRSLIKNQSPIQRLKRDIHFSNG